MAHYSFILFHKPDSDIEEKDIILDKNAVDGFIIDDIVVFRDALRWLIPDADEDHLQRIFDKLLKRTANEAKQKRYISSLINKHF